MLDKRSWKRLEWAMITQRKLQWFEIENGFCGVVNMLEVSEPFRVGKEQLTICENNFTWVQCAWENVPLWATAMFDASGNLFQIYFDLCDEVHLDQEDSWFTDLILDVVYDPHGAVSVLDEGELLAAWESGKINDDQKMKAMTAAERLVKVLETEPEKVEQWFVGMYEKSSKKPLK